MEKSFVDFEDIIKEWKEIGEKERKVSIPKTVKEDLTDGDFTIIDEEHLENSNDLFTDKDWISIIDCKNKKLVFEQNSFVIKNHLIKKGSNPNV